MLLSTTTLFDNDYFLASRVSIVFVNLGYLVPQGSVGAPIEEVLGGALVVGGAHLTVEFVTLLNLLLILSRTSFLLAAT